MQIVVLEKMSLGADVTTKEWDQIGTVTYYENTVTEEVSDRVKEADVIIVNRCKMNEESLSKAKNVKLICVTGTGTDMIDFDYTNKRGIVVSNVKGYCTHSVAQHTIAMALYLMEHLRYYDESVKSLQYIKGCKVDYSAHTFFELHNKTWGICGLGEIGKQVATIAKAFGCKVIYYSTSGKNKDTEYEQVDFETLLKESDILSIHAPLNDQTRGLFGYEQFKKMKRSSVLINVGRGAILKENEVAKALKEKLILAAGLDVLCEEPMSKTNELLTITDSSTLFITPHMAWSSREARQRVIDEITNTLKKNLTILC